MDKSEENNHTQKHSNKNLYKYDITKNIENKNWIEEKKTECVTFVKSTATINETKPLEIALKSNTKVVKFIHENCFGDNKPNSI